jgi:transcriptional regulator GlxA family with amidase domain
MGMRVVPNFSFDNHPKIDILILPGGGNIQLGEQGSGVGAQLENVKVIKWIQDTSAGAKYVMSVCNGAFFLAKAGLLENMPATTTAGFISSLPNFSPTIKPVYDKRYVDNGKIMTTAGLSSGIDGALHLVEKLDGAGWAKQIALGLEYNWQPDSDFSRGSIADVKLPNSLGNVLTSTSVPLDMRGAKRAGKKNG